MLERMEGYNGQVDAVRSYEPHDSFGVAVYTEPNEDEPRRQQMCQVDLPGTAVIAPSAVVVRVPDAEVLDAFNACSSRSGLLLDFLLQLVEIHRVQGRPIVERLRDSLASECSSLQFVDHEPTVRVDAEQVKGTALGASLAADECQTRFQEVRLRHQ